MSRLKSSPDVELLEETAIAVAQAEICALMRMRGLNRSALAKKASRSSPFITRALSGDCNLTIRTMARLFAACGYEVRFVAVPIQQPRGSVLEQLRKIKQHDRTRCAHAA